MIILDGIRHPVDMIRLTVLEAPDGQRVLGVFYKRKSESFIKATELPTRLAQSIFSRPKIMANLSIAEQHRVQTGRCEIEFNNIRHNVKVTSLPSFASRPQPLSVKKESFEEIILELT